MNIERKLDLTALMAKDNAYDYLNDSEGMSDPEFDAAAFNDAMNQKSITEWAVGMQLKNTYTTAKKIIDTI